MFLITGKPVSKGPAGSSLTGGTQVELLQKTRIQLSALHCSWSCVRLTIVFNRAAKGIIISPLQNVSKWSLKLEGKLGCVVKRAMCVWWDVLQSLNIQWRCWHLHCCGPTERKEEQQVLQTGPECTLRCTQETGDIYTNLLLLLLLHQTVEYYAKLQQDPLRSCLQPVAGVRSVAGLEEEGCDDHVQS